MIVSNKLTQCELADMATQPFFIDAAQGCFWHWRRVFVLKDDQSQLYLISLNIFERIYAALAGLLGEDYFRKTFADKKIVGQVSGSALDLLVYNTSAQRILGKQGGRSSSFEKIYQQIEDQAASWRGNADIDLPLPPFFHKQLTQRKDWWGSFAAFIGSTGLNELIDQAVPSQTGLALDIGCGRSASAIHLLERGWSVICVDYSQTALTAMERSTNMVNKCWLEKGKLKLVCSPIEDYQWPTNVDLVLASSSLPYFSPSKMQSIMQNIHQSLKTGGRFLGNFFVSSYVGSAIDAVREMGAWVLPNKESAGYLLAGHGYEVLRCEHGGEKNPHSVLFAGRKLSAD